MASTSRLFARLAFIHLCKGSNVTPLPRAISVRITKGDEQMSSLQVLPAAAGGIIRQIIMIHLCATLYILLSRADIVSIYVDINFISLDVPRLGQVIRQKTNNRRSTLIPLKPLQAPGIHQDLRDLWRRQSRFLEEAIKD